MPETPEQTLERVKVMGRDMQQKYEKVIRMQRINCVLITVLALTIGFLLALRFSITSARINRSSSPRWKIVYQSESV